MKKILITLISCMVLFGCVTTSTLKLDPRPLTGQEKVSKEGVSAVVSKKDVLVTIRPASDTYSSKERPKLVVSLYCTEGSFTFSPENIEVFVDGTPHKVFTYNELAADIKSQEKKAKETAERVRDSQYMSGGEIGGVENDFAIKEYESTIYRINKETLSSLKELNATALKNIRVQPGKRCGGCVTIEKIPNPDQSHEIKVIVKANGETHEFLLNQVEV